MLPFVFRKFHHFGLVADAGEPRVHLPELEGIAHRLANLRLPAVQRFRHNTVTALPRQGVWSKRATSPSTPNTRAIASGGRNTATATAAHDSGRRGK